jgi:hypothetical protein
MPHPKPSFDSVDARGREETSRVQNLSSVAPPPAQDERAETTYDVPTFVPPPSQSQLLRALGLVMVIGGTVALALVLVAPKLRSAPAAQRAVSPPPALPAAPQQGAQVQDAPPAQTDPAQSTTKARRAKRAAATTAEANVTSVRIRARIAPVRAAPDADAKVVCSVKRGTVMHSFQQTPGSKARWFAVHCDKDSPGWVHENFAKPMQP